MSTLPAPTPRISTAAPSPVPSDGSSAKALNRARFELELEFVQALANPYYLQSLAQQGFFAQPEFVNYLKYLGYWRQREYARFVQYPHALHHLELLQKKEFRDAIARDDWREWLNYRQFEHWRTWREPEPAPTASSDVTVPAPQEQLPSNERRDSASTANARQFRTPGTAPATALSTPLPNGTSSTRRD